MVSVNGILVENKKNVFAAVFLLMTGSLLGTFKLLETLV